ncbi:unnamed protein product [Rhizophagus irregularis]|uniref:Uncharacterized protein n=1 Tax=Rhizophagus irregularis (strain DAOM 181602 / DAOM 197198 / MUCL 43194) TaxID=747089 RepID=U9SXB7_RHIID|nr:hypothetical protein GLOIN_2v1784551 [Rhizophagus irregularis DAOM 181602=DAOM 197198]POG63063.1 hypothetical protein GLOIN_2v1784551 [Rhizophagus irregularis DAOM 181602=DAOM 197198]CAB4477767.1 unnamed protein product [Rhizophagus irregularis]|eukprot:XP_025169929.1 hypothetical protein GLOIN_2v1784551 [Rhizophagus irregularis DAOM 181602=DAOM 197198]
MSDKLLALRHKKALELLQMPGTKEHLEELARKSINITALKNITEYKEIEVRKNGVNFESVGEVIRTKSAGAGGRNFANGEERRSGNMFRIYANKDDKTGKASSSHTPRAREQPLLTKYKNDKENELYLRPTPLIQVGDLIHKEESL